jgi:hypothetical protein
MESLARIGTWIFYFFINTTEKDGSFFPSIFLFHQIRRLARVFVIHHPFVHSSRQVGHFVQKSKSVRRLCRLPRHRNHTVHLQLLSLGRRLAPPQVLEQLGHGFMRPVPAPVTRVGTPGRQIGYMDKYGVQLSVF